MGAGKRHWMLNLLIVLTVIICLLVFASHSRNWTRLQEDRMQLLTGLYFLDLPYRELDGVAWKEKVPVMERLHGFSFWAREKGVFVDSLLPEQEVYVLVDDLRQHKIKIRYRDSLTIFLNFADSLETHSMYEFLSEKLHDKSSSGDNEP
jgi:hypothetical protein